MPILNEVQLKKREEILTTLLEVYEKKYYWMKKVDLIRFFIRDIESDPVKLRVINALSASCTIRGDQSCPIN
jgi:hypothetical protein